MSKRSRKLMDAISQLLFNHFLCLGVCLLLAPCFFAGDVSGAWFDAATGQPVYTIPISSGGDHLGNVHMGDHATSGGRNLFYDKECGTWRDAKTGEEVYTIPISSGGDHLGNVHMGDHATSGGRNLFWKPCPPPESAPSSAQSGPSTQPPSDTGSSVPGFGFGFGLGGFGRGQDRNKDSGDRP